MAANSGQALVLELRLLPGEPISGWLGVPSDPPGIPFHGWIEFMIALKMLRGEEPRGAKPPP